jgi:hypothetical protein
MGWGAELQGPPLKRSHPAGKCRALLIEKVACPGQPRQGRSGQSCDALTLSPVLIRKVGQQPPRRRPGRSPPTVTL